MDASTAFVFSSTQPLHFAHFPGLLPKDVQLVVPTLNSRALKVVSFASASAIALEVRSRRRSRRARVCRSKRSMCNADRLVTDSSIDVEALAAEAELLARRSVAERLFQLPARQLKQELEVRGVDTSASLDKADLLEVGTLRGILPGAFDANASGRPRRRKLADEESPPPVIVALRRIAPLDADYIPSGVFTDGERVALPLWAEDEPNARPMWFLLDTAIRKTTISYSTAKRLGVAQDEGVARGLRFAGESVGDLPVQVVPDGIAVLGPPSAKIAGLIGPDLLYAWDIDFDVARCVCRAWPAGPKLIPGFGPAGAIEIELQGNQGLLEVSANLRGTTCSGSENSGPPLRAVVDFGQTYSACNWAAARQVGIAGAGDPCVKPAGQWLNLDGTPIDVFEAELGVELPGRVSGVLSGARVCAKRLFWLADTLPMMERLGFNPSEPMAVLGLDTVFRSRLAVSARHRRLFLPM